jgi:hypothetical protein
MADVIVKVVVQKRSDGVSQVFFAAQGDWQKLYGEVVPSKTMAISLSRNAGKCFFPVFALQAHDSHTPAFKTEDERETYVNRVVTDIQNVITESGWTFEVQREEMGIPYDSSGICMN